MNVLKRIRAYHALIACCLVLLGQLLWIGRGLTNPYAFEDTYQEYSEKYGDYAGEALKLARFTGVVGLLQYLQGESLVQVSQSRLQLLDAAIQGQTQYLEVLRLQLAMQHMKYDFLEKDLDFKQEELDRLTKEESADRLPASAEK